MPWHAAYTGPDWTDVRLMLAQLEKEYACTCVLTIFPAGGRYASAWQLQLGAMWQSLATRSSVEHCSVTLMWPNEENATMEGACYRLAWTLENELGAKRFRNQRLV